MRIVIITDAWEPQVNGVVRTYQNIIFELKKEGHDVKIIDPSAFKTISTPGYKEIPLSLFPYQKMVQMIEDFQPDGIHIAVEGPLGLAARKYCKRYNKKFTSSFHTNFPDYLSKRAPNFLSNLVRNFTIAAMRRFHKPSKAVYVATQSLEDELKSWGFQNKMVRLLRGVNTEIFYPEKTKTSHSRPQLLYVGRVSIEKNIEAFLDLDIDADKIVVGDGPSLEKLKKNYPDVTFTGKLQGCALADQYRASDCFVFPSKTDTFGIVLIEALACGLPVAAYNVMGPKDILVHDFLGSVDDDLGVAVAKAMANIGTPEDRFRHIKDSYTWESVAKVFISQQRLP